MHRDLTALLWTEFKHRDVRRGTKQEIPDLTRVHSGDWKAVSPSCSRNLPELLQGTASVHALLPLTPETNSGCRSWKRSTPFPLPPFHQTNVAEGLLPTAR